MNGISLGEYIRNRKLTLAGYDLKSTDMKVVEVSYKYGWDSPTSFTKAFQKFHNVTPKQARNKDVQLRVFAKLQFTKKMHYTWRVQETSPLRLIGISVFCDAQDAKLAERIPAFWSEVQQNGAYAELISYDTALIKGIFALFEYEKNRLRYSLMVCSDQPLPQGYHEVLLPESTWAIFDCKGAVPQAIQQGWRFLEEEWLVKYPFQHAPLPELEWYGAGNIYSEDYDSQIWIPIKEDA